MDRVWFENGSLFARIATGGVFSTSDFERWVPARTSSVPPLQVPAAARLPRSGASLRSQSGAAQKVWALGNQVWKSDDGGRTWNDLTSWQGGSLLGGAVLDLAVDPGDENRVAVGAASGVWVSNDGGLSWAGLNEGLPSLSVRRILSAARGPRGVRMAMSDGDSLNAYEWAPGQRLGWIPVEDPQLAAEAALSARVAESLGTAVTTAVQPAAEFIYAAGADSRIWTSQDSGATWSSFQHAGSGTAVLRFWTAPADPRIALCVLDDGPAGEGPRVLRTLNGGRWWDDLTSNLPLGPAYGIAADLSTGAVYVATSRGVFLTIADLRAPAPATPWVSLSAALPEAAVRDVFLDEQGLQLFAAIDGYGLFASPAPHRRLAPLLVHSADFGTRAASPGALLTLLGARVESAQANSQPASVLAAGDNESQIQIPYDSAGDSLRLVLQGAQGQLAFGLPLRPAAPALLTDREGTPMILDTATGLQVDLMNPAMPGMRLQLLASGLGRVDPDWPTGLAAPIDSPPKVRAPVLAFLDGQPLQVVSATLAPGYIGFYIVEVELPALLDEGASELRIEAAGLSSNRIRVYVGHMRQPASK